MKMIHEQLRECETWRDLDKMLGLTDNVFWSESFKKLADEIEKHYFAKPHFEDGTPVQFGDETGNGAADSFTFYDTCDVDIYVDNGSDSVFVPRGEFVKRQTKIL